MSLFPIQMMLQALFEFLENLCLKEASKLLLLSLVQSVVNDQMCHLCVNNVCDTFTCFGKIYKKNFTYLPSNLPLSLGKYTSQFIFTDLKT